MFGSSSRKKYIYIVKHVKQIKETYDSKPSDGTKFFLRAGRVRQEKSEKKSQNLKYIDPKINIFILLRKINSFTG